MIKNSAFLDPTVAGKLIQNDYLEYLKTNHRPDDEALRQEFHKAIESFELAKGPFLHASPPFKHGSSLKSLVGEEILDDQFLLLPSDVFPPERNLYVHQEKAIRKILDNRNLIIATGTGSGKTECFLFPIIQALFEEMSKGTLANSGVRALLLYPMNALANDQMKRLREILKFFPEITFGRYIGDTKPKYDQAREAFLSQNGHLPMENELISREQIQQSPPHILLTNYSMLEYLLLRPADTALFDGETGRHWKFVVLDEVHVYSGAKGAEIAMLLQRVKARVTDPESRKITFIGTSATLGSGEEQAKEVVKFASDLFGEKVEFLPDNSRRQDLVLPELDTIQSSIPTWVLDEELIDSLYRTVRHTEDLDEVMNILGSPDVSGSNQTDLWQYLWEILKKESHVIKLQLLLEEKSVIDFKDAANRLFAGTESERFRKLTQLLEICTKASLTGSSASLIPAKFHYFLRALEGAYVCVSPAHPKNVSNFNLSRQKTCVACENVQTVSRMFELALCSSCGTSYLVGKLDKSDDVFIHPKMSEERLDYLWLVSGSSLTPEEFNEDEKLGDEDDDLETDVHILCTSCGKLSQEKSVGCDCSQNQKIEVKKPRIQNKKGTLSKCVKCSKQSPFSVVKRFLSGAERPQSIIASSIYQSLPPSSEEETSYGVGEGRKLLAFADGRQDAAFFAPYLDRVYSKAVRRQALLELLTGELAGTAPRFNDLIQPLLRIGRETQTIDEDDGDIANKTEIETWLMAELLAIDTRESLEGVGLLEISIAIPKEIKKNPPQMLLDMGFSEDEIFDLARILLSTLRRSSIVDFPTGVDPKDPLFSPRNYEWYIRFEEPDEKKHIKSWIPKRGLNSNLDYLTKVFQARQIDRDPKEVLKELWTNWFARNDGPWQEVLRATRRKGSKGGVTYALNPSRIEFLSSSETHQPFRCQKCAKIWWRSISGICPGFRCEGKLTQANEADLSENFYFRYYKSLLPTGMRVNEHTGQLDSTYAAEIQQDFVDGKVNVISGSTTWELGVDVGDVKAIMMRNFPPSPANYVQRAGRAGRRLGSSALIVTYARRKSHDLQHYAQPERMIEGKIPPPIISIANERIVRRHLHAVAFAAFEKRHVEDGGEPHKSVDDFFSPREGMDSGFDRFMAWLRSRPDELLIALKRICPVELVDQIGLENWEWAEALVDASNEENPHFGWLERAATQIQNDLGELDSRLATITTQVMKLHKDGQAEKAEKINKVTYGIYKTRNTIAKKRLLDYLASRVVLPKYGFPVDVADLQVTQGREDRESTFVELSRDLKLAIAEYAPGEKTVANKRQWESTGLRVFPQKKLLEYQQWECKECGEYGSRISLITGPKPPCPSCGSTDKLTKPEFVVPEFGFVGRMSPELPGDSRPQRNTSTEFHYSDYQYSKGQEPFETLPACGGKVDYKYSRQGQITVVTNSVPFRLCHSCGFAEKANEASNVGDNNKGHKRPNFQGDLCTSVLVTRHLGHQYLTDVVELKISSVENRDSALSVMYALLASTTRIGIEPGDLGGTLRSGNSMVIFDSVSGGAGHVKRFIESFEDLAEEALLLVNNCDCGTDTSCYGCLRNFDNQNVHENLQRGLASEILSFLAVQ